MQPIQLLAVVSDPHCGSTVGLMTPKYRTLERVTVHASPLQSWLWECWQDSIQFVKDIRGKSPLAFVVNGDAIEGVHHGTKQVISPDAGDHKQLAIRCLQPFADLAVRRYMVKGTECHTNNSEISIAHALGFEMNPDFPREKDEAENDGAYVFDKLDIRINGVRCIIRHHMPTSVRRQLAATQLSIQLGEEQLEAANNGEEIPRVLGMAHRHRDGLYEDDNGIAFVTSAFQGLTRHGYKVVPNARCKPSITVLDWRGKKQGELPKVHHRAYRTPAQTPIFL